MPLRPTARAFASSRYSWLSLRPKRPYELNEYGYCRVCYWRDWARKNGILDKHGKPSYGKVQTLIKYHCLAAIKSKAYGERHGGGSKWWVGPVSKEQLDWKPEDWQEQVRILFSRSQSNKAKKRRKY